MKHLDLIDAAEINNAQNYIKSLLNKILKDSNLPTAIFVTSKFCKNILEEIFNYKDLKTDLEKESTKLIPEAIYLKHKPNFSIEEIVDECLKISDDEFCLDHVFIDEINNITAEKKHFDSKKDEFCYATNKLSELSSNLNATVIVFKNLEEAL